MNIELRRGSRVVLSGGLEATLRSYSPDTQSHWATLSDGTERWISRGSIESVIIEGGRHINVDQSKDDWCWKSPGLVSMEELSDEQRAEFGIQPRRVKSSKTTTAAVDVGRSAIAISVETILRRDDLPGREVVVREADGKRTVSVGGCSFEGMSLDETRMVAEMLIEATKLGSR